MGQYFFFGGLAEMAGKTTVVQLLADLRVGQWLGYAMAASFGGGWAVERRNKRRIVERTGRREKELEKRIDGQRSSSRLTSRGTPPREED